jgi:hypothetical protein
MLQGIHDGTGMCGMKGKKGVRARKVESGVQATPNLLFIQPSRFSWMFRITVVYVKPRSKGIDSAKFNLYFLQIKSSDIKSAQAVYIYKPGHFLLLL